MATVHPLIQTARGALTDEDYGEAESILALAVEAAKDLEAENERFRKALSTIFQAAKHSDGVLFNAVKHVEAETRLAADENLLPEEGNHG